MDKNVGFCEENLLHLDMTLYVSMNDGDSGSWSSLENYQLNSTVYVVSFNGFSATNSYFDEQLAFMSEKLKNRSINAVNRDLAW